MEKWHLTCSHVLNCTVGSLQQHHNIRFLTCITAVTNVCFRSKEKISTHERCESTRSLRSKMSGLPSAPCQPCLPPFRPLQQHPAAIFEPTFSVSIPTACRVKRPLILLSAKRMKY